MFFSTQSLALCALALLPSASAQYSNASSLPVVDLGYELHRAIAFNQTGGYYNFSNIRYAAPPLGALRFTTPQPPAVNRSVIQDGSVARVCPQGNPSWTLSAAQWLPGYITSGKLPNITEAQIDATNASYTTAQATTLNQATTEDCLFLDVMVPDKIFEERGKGYGAPVMVWIYGGGYTEGSKTGSGNPAGLLYRSEFNGTNAGVIYVAMNYRLGAFGWLAGPTLQSNGTANAALYDQRMALEWVQKNIALFGGDPNRVTVFGESAGGGSIMHQITAFGGLKGKVPFQQAIPQSPGWFPLTSNLLMEETLDQFLTLLNVSTIEAARQLPSETLIVANAVQVAHAGYGQFVYGPAVDGSFVPALPGKLLLQGSFDKDVRVMVGHNANEGLLFTDPLVTNEATFEQFVATSLPLAAPSVVNYVTDVLYPPVFDGSLGYSNELQRTALAISELVFTCNTNYLDRAYNNDTYSYLFSVFPATHGEDIAYTYYDNTPANFGALLFNTTTAVILQDWLTTFTITGRPSSPDVNGIPMFNMYGANATVEDLDLSSVTRVMDPASNARCLWWQKALYT